MTDRYDYIVVGSGAGGGPLAANLAKAGYRVLLLEAGEDAGNSHNYQVPAFSCAASDDPEMRWDYFVRHYSGSRQKNDPNFCAERDGVWYPRAGTLGGCTAHNAMITVYPQNGDWDYIAAVTGDESWHSDAMRCWFERLESCRYRPLSQIAAYLGWNHGRRGFSGWLPTTRASVLTLFRDAELRADLLRFWGAAVAELSDPACRFFRFFRSWLGDPNDWFLARHNGEGTRFTPLAVVNGRRVGAREYVRAVEAAHPDRLLVATGSLATRVLLDESNRATGVEYLHGKHLYRADPLANGKRTGPGEARTAHAAREVILSAGAFNTPQLLKLSGIGPREELTRLGIPVRSHLPGVGENLQDRYEMTVVLRMKKPFPLLKGATFTAPAPGQSGDRYFEQWRYGAGPYAANGGIFNFVKRSISAAVDPDLFIFSGVGNFQGYAPGYSRKVFSEPNYFTWCILKAHTANTAGQVLLRSADARDVPKINFKYFEEGNDAAGDDLEAVVDGVEFVQQLRRHWAHKVDAEVFPGPGVQTREQLREFVKDHAWGHHASCTCKIGAANDPMAVLDSRFRVRGVRNLRVVDASVFPRIPGYFIAAAIYMISEKASAAILEDAQPRGRS